MQHPAAVRAQMVVLLAASVACGGAPNDDGANADRVEVRGVSVVLETRAAFARAPDFPARVESTIDAALRYWGGSWSAVDRRFITLVDDAYVTCGGDARSLGCFDHHIWLTTRDPGVGPVPCIEATVLVHEIGHAVIGDPRHTDPRWMEMDELAEELSGRLGYTDAGETLCLTYPSVWRHPLDSP